MVFPDYGPIMIVGGGFGQVPAIHAARSMGLRTLVVDRSSDVHGMRLADIAVRTDIRDIESVVATARSHRVCGVMTLQSDVGVPTVGAVVDDLGLTGSGRAVAERCSNKIFARETFAKHDVPQPDFMVVVDEMETRHASAAIGFPLIIKTPDSSGSRGVVKVNGPAEIPAAFAEAMLYSSSGQLLVEEFIDGVEVGAQCFSLDGRCVIVLIHDDELSDPPHMVPVAHAFPSSLNRYEHEKAEAAVKGCVEAVGITTGPANIDLILDHEGNPKIIEIGARIGATCLPELVFHHTGIDWVRAAVQAAIDVMPDLFPQGFQPCAAYILRSPRDGVMHSYTIPSELANKPDILEWEVTAQPGDTVSRLRKGTDRIGKVIARGATQHEAMELARRFSAGIEFKISTT